MPKAAVKGGAKGKGLNGKVGPVPVKVIIFVVALVAAYILYKRYEASKAATATTSAGSSSTPAPAATQVIPDSIGSADTGTGGVTNGGMGGGSVFMQGGIMTTTGGGSGDGSGGGMMTTTGGGSGDGSGGGMMVIDPIIRSPQIGGGGGTMGPNAVSGVYGPGGGSGLIGGTVLPATPEQNALPPMYLYINSGGGQPTPLDLSGGGAMSLPSGGNVSPPVVASQPSQPMTGFDSSQSPQGQAPPPNMGAATALQAVSANQAMSRPGGSAGSLGGPRFGMM
jgi:hypothetical protein